jgi:signal peptidase I
VGAAAGWLRAPLPFSLGARLAALAAAPLLAALAIRLWALEPFEVASESMLPTLRVGDRLLVNKLATPERGDVVVFERGGERLVKRIVALPGERVAVRGGRVLVNGVPAPEWPTGGLHVDAEGRALAGWREQLGGVEHATLDDPEERGAECEAAVPANHYYVLGDNRDHSADSRRFGPIPREQIVGVVTDWLGRGPRFEQQRADAE